MEVSDVKYRFYTFAGNIKHKKILIMAVKYGITWWGEKWLDALTDIDHSNRLPRGKRYANNGSVKDILVNGNKIKAKVQGTEIKPYDVEVGVSDFTSNKKQILMNAVLDNPLILARLLNRELPEELHEIAEQKNISVFPKSWKDLKMYCSCPDWAVPCKHLAATIYMIANEIDRNPFTIFLLHGLDILDELERNGLPPEDIKINIPALDQKLVKQDKLPSQSSGETEFDPGKLDLSVIPKLEDTLLSMLDDQTLFYNSDFKKRLKTTYRKTRKEVKNYLNIAGEKQDEDDNFEQYRSIEIRIWDKIDLKEARLLNEEGESLKKIETIEEIIIFLENIPAKRVNQLSHPLLAFYLTYKFAVKLLLQGAFIPELLEVPDKKYLIRWLPAFVNAKVKSIADTLAALLPGKVVQVADKQEDSKYLLIDEQFKTLISLFLNYFVHSTAPYYAESSEAVEKMFFMGKAQSFDGLGEHEIPQTIHRWLSKFYIHHKDHVPVIQVQDNDNEFIVDVLVENRSDNYQQPVRLQEFLEDKKYQNIKTGVLKDLALLTSSFHELQYLIQTSGKKPLKFDSADFQDVLLRILPLIRMYGIKVLLPNSLKNLVRPKTSLSLSKKSEDQGGQSFLSLDKMLDFNWRVALGDKVISTEEFLNLARNFSGIVKIKDQYVIINQDEIEKLTQNLEKPPALKTGELIQTALTGEYKGAKIAISEEAKKLIQSYLEIKHIEPPEGLRATLRPYQLRGYEWMYKNVNMGIGSIIADDMGLGKTIQVIAVLQKLKEENRLEKRKALIIVPTTLLSNWEKEFTQFAPGLDVFIYHGPGRKLETEHDVVITSYGIARSDEAVLKKGKWQCQIIDESQNIKNPNSGQTKAVKKIKSNVRIAMSGTPVENRLSEYWSVFDYANKGYLGSLKNFKEEYANPIELDRDQKKVDLFRTVTSPFIMRRVKTDKSIISDLPDKTENNHFSRLTQEQAALYKSIVDNLMPSIDSKENDKDAKVERRGLIFKLMLSLKQVCNHPGQYLKKQQYDPDTSGKTQLLFQLLENIYEAREKVLIFTQFKEAGLMLERLIKERFEEPVLFLHGGTSRKKREQMVEEFQNKSHIKTFVLSIKAGGTGLNLTAASNVIHFDLWWNPAVEQQATDRAFRIGQNKNVMVYRLITRNTFEEKINEMIQSKKELANMTVSAGEKWIGDLSSSELKSLVELE